MKKNRLFLIVLLLALYSCSSSEYWKLKIELPGKAAFNLDPFKEILITNFLVKKEAKDFSLNKELKDYFAFEFKQNIKKKVSLKEVSLDKEELFENEEFWKNLSQGATDTLLFAGSVQYMEETRKALLKKEKKRFEDPFPEQTRLAQRKFYTLEADLYFIDAHSGKTLYKRTYKETQSYKNPNQTAYFAFFDLLQTLKDKLLRNLLGTEQVQERYLISN